MQLGTKAALRHVGVGLVFLPVAEPFNQEREQEGEDAPLGVVPLTVGEFMGEDRHLDPRGERVEFPAHIDTLVPEAGKRTSRNRLARLDNHGCGLEGIATGTG